MTLLRLSEQRGAALVEYRLVVGLLAVSCMLSVTYFGNELGCSFKHSAETVGARQYSTCPIIFEEDTPVAPDDVQNQQGSSYYE